MAGYSKIYCIGGEGGFLGADGMNLIDFQILVGDGGQQWLEVHYFNRHIQPMGRIKSIIPKGPDHPDALIDACLVFSQNTLSRVLHSRRSLRHLGMSRDSTLILMVNRPVGGNFEKRQDICLSTS